MIIGILTYPPNSSSPLCELLRQHDVDCISSTDPEVLSRADGLIISSPGPASNSMNAFDALSCTQWIREINKPVLGINHGMHLLTEGHEEDQHHYLGVVPGRVQSFHQHQCTASNMGWHSLHLRQEHPLLHGIGPDQRLYFIHQDFLPPLEHAIATATCENTFTAVVAKHHFMGVQFSPEKSGRAGSMLLQNFLTIVEKQD